MDIYTVWPEKDSLISKLKTNSDRRMKQTAYNNRKTFCIKVVALFFLKSKVKI